MSLDRKQTIPQQNMNGRPKGALGKKTHQGIKERLLGKWKTHPADKLVEIANCLYLSGKPEQIKQAADIWANLLKYFEPTKKPVESAPEKTTPEESAAAAEETYKLLEALENHGLDKATSSEGNGVEKAPAVLPPQTSAEEDLSGHPKL